MARETRELQVISKKAGSVDLLLMGNNKKVASILATPHNIYTIPRGFILTQGERLQCLMEVKKTIEL